LSIKLKTLFANLKICCSPLNLITYIILRCWSLFASPYSCKTGTLYSIHECLCEVVHYQISGEIKAAHSMFLSYMELLETQLNEMNNSIERRKDQLKGVHAPKLAKLALHTDAINNRVKYGEFISFHFYYG
jgi:hypothetical protein